MVFCKLDKTIGIVYHFSDRYCSYYSHVLQEGCRKLKQTIVRNHKKILLTIRSWINQKYQTYLYTHWFWKKRANWNMHIHKHTPLRIYMHMPCKIDIIFVIMSWNDWLTYTVGWNFQLEKVARTIYVNNFQTILFQHNSNLE